MKSIIFSIITSLLLSGCGLIRMHEQAQEEALYASCDKYVKFVDKVDCLNKISASDKNLYKIYGAQELIAYSAILAEKVKTGQMTDTEAKFEIQHKKNQLIQEEAQLKATNRVNMPRSTNCTGFGNSINCTSY